MVMAAGAIFWLARALLAAIPTLALLWPVKKIAAAIAMLGATAYCVFSGSEVATERALVMTLVMLGAVLVDRPALSMRNLALSALIVLAREPEALLGPSFQMSYAAVAALIAAAEWARGRFPPAEPAGAVGRALRWLAFAGFALVATTLVASLATAPFGSFHFHALNPFGLIGNALAVPLVSLVVMPCAVVGVLAFPFGLDRPIWELMGVAVAAVLRVSHWVSGFDGSTLVVPAYGADALGLMALALIVVTVLVSPLRLAALLPAAAGVWLAATPKRFDVYVDRSGAGAAIRGARGELVTTGHVSAFVVEQWLRADGDARKPDDAGLAAGGRCDALGCVALLGDGRAVALVKDRRAFAEDCSRAFVVISPLAGAAGLQAGGSPRPSRSWPRTAPPRSASRRPGQTSSRRGSRASRVPGCNGLGREVLLGPLRPMHQPIRCRTQSRRRPTRGPSRADKMIFDRIAIPTSGVRRHLLDQ